MHIRYKQSCLIILRHISDRVINKHCKINEEKCDLQFPLIGKALAIPRHKVITVGLRRGEGQAKGCCPLGPGPPGPSSAGTPGRSGQLGGGGGAEPPGALWPQTLRLQFEVQRDCSLTPGGPAQRWAPARGSWNPPHPLWSRPPGHLLWVLGSGGVQASGRPPGPLPGPLPALSRLLFKAFCSSAIYSEDSAASSYF